MPEGLFQSAYGDVYSKDGKAWLKSPAGLVAVDPGEAASKLATGIYKPATRDEALAEEVRIARDTLGQQALAFTEAAGAGALDVAQAPITLPIKAGAALAGAEDPTQAISGRATIESAVSLGGSATQAAGLTEQTGEALGAQYAQEARERAQVNPGTAFAGSLLGQAAGGFGLGGGLKALGTAGIEAVGGGGAAALALRGGLGAVEGAAYGAATATEESYIQDRQLTSEQMLTHLGVGAFIGGLVGFGAEGLTQGIKRARVPASPVVSRGAPGAIPATDDALAQAATAGPLAGEPAASNLAATWRKLFEAGNERLSTLQSAATGADREAIERFSPLNPKMWEKAENHPYDLLHNRTQILEGATQDVTTQVQALTEKAQAVGREVWEVPAKQELVAKNLATLAPEDAANSLKTVNAMARDLRLEIRNAAELAGADATGTGRYLEDLADWTTVEQATAKGDLPSTYVALDKLKRTMQNKIHTTGSTIDRELNPFIKDQKRIIVDQLEQTQQKLRSFLEDEGVWGKQGMAQRETNAGLTRWFRYRDFFNQNFMTKTGREYGGAGGGPIFEADREKIGAYIQNLGKKTGSLKDKAFREFVAATEDFTDSIGRNYEPGSSTAAALADVKAAAAEIRGRMGKADLTVKTANQIDEIVQPGGGNGLGAIGRAGIGGMLGGPLGALGGLALGAVAHPGQLIRQAAAIKQIAARVDLQVGKSLAAFFTRATGAAQPVIGAAKTAGKAAGRGSKVATVGALAAFRGKHASLESAYHARVSEVLKANADHGAQIRERARDSMGDLPHLTPKLTQAIIAGATNAAAFLQNKIPSGLVSPTIFQPTRPAPVDRAKAEEFARIWATVNSPLSALEDLKTGRLMPSQVEALQAVYPKLYEQIRTNALEMLRTLDMQGVQVPYRDKLQLDVLFDLGGAGEATMSPDFALRLDSLRQEQQAQHQGAQPPMREAPLQAADAAKTTLQRLEGQ